MIFKCFIYFIILAQITVSGSEFNCNEISFNLEEIVNKTETVNEIIYAVINGNESGVTNDELIKFTDKFGHRFADFDSLELSIDYVIRLFKNLGINVYIEHVEFKAWKRGEESAIVSTFDELKNRSNEVNGKIVEFKFNFTKYEERVQYSYYGASEASRYGAVAALIKSLTPFSLYTLHTGTQNYFANFTRIPAASITSEDAELIARLSKSETVKVELILRLSETQEKPMKSRNVLAEVKG
ncbi:carboxypeptidase Q-like protein [Dinothrombium tinctorium]|uniref:Carboxypeptidase Q-like protein n=1 Tax=Dinothrombium tinctorium TaxID=1965070 RepID=A0A3S3PL40_9ACAR|nr:carboxypeptidase Q-like protein [Dinothrombium tinctorium]RWS03550.1 carboxypeptidase Q-like protein [Dinothrombium tinctorium]RWS06390.1 carboxypeptidase Q-like protein [Dinothrombium tinctorium]RWS06397.1 carboxypeptidase Q-like protein [Dinothrombium tinctorium]